MAFIKQVTNKQTGQVHASAIHSIKPGSIKISKNNIAEITIPVWDSEASKTANREPIDNVRIYVSGEDFETYFLPEAQKNFDDKSMTSDRQVNDTKQEVKKLRIKKQHSVDYDFFLKHIQNSEKQIFNPEAYLDSIVEKYGDKNLHRLKNVLFNKWHENLEHWGKDGKQGKYN